MAMINQDPSAPRPGQAGMGRWLRIAVFGRNPKRTLARIVILVVTCVVVFKFVLLPIRVDGISMQPAYKDRSVNFINRLAYRRHEPRRGDVVGIMVGGTNNPYRTPRVMYMKRVVGLPGETVAFADGQLLINGVPLDEPYVNGPCDWNSAPVTVGSNEYFVVGDNRSMPQELHVQGKAEKQQIVGKVLY
ncbi:MAG: signal peptidase I [Verrucomicrobiota bacterium]|jgi:signal peptidase I